VPGVVTGWVPCSIAGWKNPKLQTTCGLPPSSLPGLHVLCSFGFFGFFGFLRRFFGYFVALSLVCLIFLVSPMVFWLFADVCLVW
jgi:hypothetical protein